MYGASGVLNWNTYERLARAVTLRSPLPRGSLPDSGQRQWLPQSPVSHWTPETQIRRGRLGLPELVVQKGVSCTERRAPQVPRAGALAYLVECWDCYERGKTPEPLQSEANPKDLRVQGRAIAAGGKRRKKRPWRKGKQEESWLLQIPCGRETGRNLTHLQLQGFSCHGWDYWKSLRLAWVWGWVRRESRADSPATATRPPSAGSKATSDYHCGEGVYRPGPEGQAQRESPQATSCHTKPKEALARLKSIRYKGCIATTETKPKTNPSQLRPRCIQALHRGLTRGPSILRHKHHTP